jgi:hypothetical protein
MDNDKVIEFVNKLIEQTKSSKIEWNKYDRNQYSCTLNGIGTVNIIKTPMEYSLWVRPTGSRGSKLMLSDGADRDKIMRFHASITRLYCIIDESPPNSNVNQFIDAYLISS